MVWECHKMILHLKKCHLIQKVWEGPRSCLLLFNTDVQNLGEGGSKGVEMSQTDLVLLLFNTEFCKFRGRG